MIRYGLLFAGFFLLLTFSAHAQQKVAFVDITVVLKDSKVGKSATGSFQKEVESKRTLIEKKKKALDDMRQDIIENGSVMSESKRRTLAETIEKKQKDLERTREDVRLELQRMDFELTQKMVKEVKAIVAKIGKEQNFDIILEKTEAGVFYGGDSADITQQVISAYDASM